MLMSMGAIAKIEASMAVDVFMSVWVAWCIWRLSWSKHSFSHSSSWATRFGWGMMRGNDSLMLSFSIYSPTEGWAWYSMYIVGFAGGGSMFARFLPGPAREFAYLTLGIALVVRLLWQIALPEHEDQRRQRYKDYVIG